MEPNLNANQEFHVRVSQISGKNGLLIHYFPPCLVSERIINRQTPGIWSVVSSPHQYTMQSKTHSTSQRGCSNVVKGQGTTVLLDTTTRWLPRKKKA
eukprot:1045763_1